MAARPPKRPPADPNAAQEAVRWFRDRLIMTDEEFQTLEDATHDVAFTVAGVNQLDLVTEVWEAVDKAIANGETLQDFQARVSDRLTAAWGKDQPWRVENILRNQAQRAYGAGRWAQMTEPVVVQARPYRRLSNIMDQRTSPICVDVALGGVGGTVLPADDPFWRSHVPPLHHGCRSHIVTLSEAEAKEDGVTPTPPATPAAAGFGSAPDVGPPFEPELDEYPPELAAAYREAGT